MNLNIDMTLLLLAAARFTGMLLTAPVFSHGVIPHPLRAMMAMVMALAVAGRLAPAAAPVGAAELGLGLLAEGAIGAMIGYVAAAVFAGVELAAFHIGMQLGVNLGDVYSQSGEEEAPMLGGLMGMLTIAVFLLIGGHREFIGGLLCAFRAAPAGGLSPQASWLAAAGGVLAGSFELGLRLAAPVLVTLLLATAAMGFLQKVLPQCHILSTGLPARALLGLVALAAGVAVLGWAVQVAWSQASRAITDLVKVSV